VLNQNDLEVQLHLAHPRDSTPVCGNEDSVSASIGSVVSPTTSSVRCVKRLANL